MPGLQNRGLGSLHRSPATVQHPAFQSRSSILSDRELSVSLAITPALFVYGLTTRAEGETAH
jgi:hypothetical protein